jgi:hypothetical protein
MKVYSINKWAFRAICLLIIILPVSRHWRLLSTGEKAPGIVTGFVMHKEDVLVGESEMYYASEIVFYVEGIPQSAFGPENYEYKTGREIMVFYDGDDPSENCIATFSGFYLDGYTVLPIILLVVWAAFYMSFNSYQRKQRFKRTRYPRSEDQSGPGRVNPGSIIGGPIQAARKISGSKSLSSKK